MNKNIYFTPWEVDLVLSTEWMGSEALAPDWRQRMWESLLACQRIRGENARLLQENDAFSAKNAESGRPSGLLFQKEEPVPSCDEAPRPPAPRITEKMSDWPGPFLRVFFHLQQLRCVNARLSFQNRILRGSRSHAQSKSKCVPLTSEPTKA